MEALFDLAVCCIMWIVVSRSTRNRKYRGLVWIGFALAAAADPWRIQMTSLSNGLTKMTPLAQLTTISLPDGYIVGLYDCLLAVSIVAACYALVGVKSRMAMIGIVAGAACGLALLNLDINWFLPGTTFIVAGAVPGILVARKRWWQMKHSDYQMTYVMSVLAGAVWITGIARFTYHLMT